MPTESTSRTVLSNRTNAPWPLRSPPSPHTLKRRISPERDGSKKRVRLETTASVDQQHDIEMHNGATKCLPLRIERENRTNFNTLRATRMRPHRAFQNASLSSRPILTSFVSSNKIDVYKFYSREDPMAPGLPFACAYANGAKEGGIPVLAVAMQEGTIELLNVAKRQDWDFEPQRTTIQVHTNAILDIKWGKGDRRLATSSGDSTTRITSVTTQQCLAVLAHHTSSVKSLDWDPGHDDLLSTASRDGSICVWDLRAAGQSKMNEDSIAPVMVIRHAHCDVAPRGKAAKSRTASKTVTSVLYLPQNSRQLVSSGSFDGVLKHWDLRYPIAGLVRKSVELFESSSDPTMATGSRGRGVSSLALGRNHSAGFIWGMAADSRIYTYTLPFSAPFNGSDPQNTLTHPGLFVNSFYVKLAASPCGSWLASGSSGGGVYLWDVTRRSPEQKAVELKAAGREVGAVDWAGNSIAACCDDGIVRVWRPDLEVSAMCKADPEEKKWDWTWACDDL